VQPAITQGEFAARIWAAGGQSGTPKTSVIGRRVIIALSLVVSVVRDFTEMVYESDKPFIVDSSAFESAFRAHTTPIEVAIEATVAHYRGALVAV